METRTTSRKIHRQARSGMVQVGLNGKATPEYNAWASMKHRCQSPKNQILQTIGGRGITVCAEWSESFETFLADVGYRPTAKHSLGRIDNDGNYEPSNCRWETVTQQQRNKRSCHYVKFLGRTMTVTEAAEISGKNVETVRTRVSRGWEIERAVS
jgi:hypothetical protein